MIAATGEIISPHHLIARIFNGYSPNPALVRDYLTHHNGGSLLERSFNWLAARHISPEQASAQLRRGLLGGTTAALEGLQDGITPQLRSTGDWPYLHRDAVAMRLGLTNHRASHQLANELIEDAGKWLEQQHPEWDLLIELYRLPVTPPTP